jgi:O-antigen/teichoic acid export membrane protein
MKYFKDLRHREFFIIAGSRYYNLFTEYVVLLATAWLLPPAVRGTYVMAVSVISLSSMIASLAFEQYGVTFSIKYSLFNAKAFFIGVMNCAVIVSFFTAIFTYTCIKNNILISLLVGLNVINITIYKQGIVIFQVEKAIKQYYKIFLIGRTVNLLTIIFAAYVFNSLVSILVAMVLSSGLNAALVCSRLPISSTNGFDFKIFRKYFLKAKWLYLTTIVTGLYGFVDLYIIYSKIGQSVLSVYNLAMQFNAAIAVLGQAYTVYVFSDQDRSSLLNILRSIDKVNVVIVVISLVVIGFIYTPFFEWIINSLFEKKYPQLYRIISMTVWVLPTSLISMFYAPLWISSGKYVLLLMISVTSLCVFSFIAIQFIDKGINGIIYAQYYLGSISLLINYGFYQYAKKKYKNC